MNNPAIWIMVTIMILIAVGSTLIMYLFYRGSKWEDIEQAKYSILEDE